MIRPAALRHGCRAICAGFGVMAIATAAGAQAGPGSGAPQFAPVGVSRGMPGAGPLFQTTSASRGRPPVEPARVVGEALAGAYAGLAAYFVGGWAGGLVADQIDGASDALKDRIRFTSGVVLGGFTTAASVAAIGNIGDQTGSYSAALAGTAGGVAAGLLLNQLLYGHARLPTEGQHSRMRWIEASLEAMLPSVGATIAFTSSRRYK